MPGDLNNGNFRRWLPVWSAPLSRAIFLLVFGVPAAAAALLQSRLW